MYRSLKGIFRAVLTLTYDVRTEGMENLHDLPTHSAFVMAANHGSIVDAFVMGLRVDGYRVRFVGRQRTLWSNPIFGKINTIVGTIPVPESTVKDKSVVVSTSVQALREGASIGIFPEGAILRRRKSFEGRSGMARMALEAGVPIVPVGLIGTDGLWPYGAKMPRLGKPVEFIIGKPMDFSAYHGMQANRDVVRYVTDCVMREVRSLSGWYDVPAEEIVRLYNYYHDLKPPVI